MHEIICAQEFTADIIYHFLGDLKEQKNEFSFNDEFFDLKEVVFQALNIVLDRANKKEIELIAEVQCQSFLSLIEHIQGDPKRFVQILINLLENAI